jgi:soluble P-type ATPase
MMFLPPLLEHLAAGSFSNTWDEKWAIATLSRENMQSETVTWKNAKWTIATLSRENTQSELSLHCHVKICKVSYLYTVTWKYAKWAIATLSRENMQSDTVTWKNAKWAIATLSRENTQSELSLHCHVKICKVSYLYTVTWKYAKWAVATLSRENMQSELLLHCHVKICSLNSEQPRPWPKDTRTYISVYIIFPLANVHVHLRLLIF